MMATETIQTLQLNGQGVISDRLASFILAGLDAESHLAQSIFSYSNLDFESGTMHRHESLRTVNALLDSYKSPLAISSKVEGAEIYTHGVPEHYLELVWGLKDRIKDLDANAVKPALENACRIQYQKDFGRRSA